MTHASSTVLRPAGAVPKIAFPEALKAWARVALLSFGGPAGQIAVMHRIIVDEKKWVSEPQFLHALNYCMLLPGPEAQQLATYLGWLLNGVRGGLAAGILFILPGAVAIMALSVVYALFGATDIVNGLFFGLKAAVLSIVVQAVIKVAKRALKSTAMRIVAAAAFLAIFLLGVPFPAIILTAGILGFIGAYRGGQGVTTAGGAEPIPSKAGLSTGLVALACLALWLLPVGVLLVSLGPENVFSKIAVFFSKMALVTFGGAYAVLAYVAQQAVETHHWLRPGEMLDGLGMAETTPGPLIMVLQFVGFMAAFRDPGQMTPLVAGIFGGLLATWVTFVPCFLWIFAGAPFIETLRGNKVLDGALSAITAAVVGVILNLAIWFSIHTIFGEVTEYRRLGLSVDLPVLASVDVFAAVLSLAAALAIFRLKAGVFTTLFGCGLIGILLKLGGLHG